MLCFEKQAYEKEGFPFSKALFTWLISSRDNFHLGEGEASFFWASQLAGMKLFTFHPEVKSLL